MRGPGAQVSLHLEAGLVNSAIQRCSVYTGISSADGQALGLKLPYGIARLPCSRLTPSSTSQADAARQLAEAAAEAKPEYRDQIALLGL